MLRIRDLSVTKANQIICRVGALNVDRGERVGLLGANGCGKTTLLRVVAGLEREFTGECHSDVPRSNRVYVHQSPYLFRGSALFNVRYGLAARKVPRKKQLINAHVWLDRLGVGHLARRRCAKLSGGEQRRIALARALAIEADLVLLDEPFADLDPQGIEALCQALATVEHATVLLASPVPLPEALAARSISL